MMRLFYTVLFLLVTILGVWTFMIAPENGWWFPENYSTYGDSIDGLFNLIMWFVAVTFVGTEVVLAYCIFKYPHNKPGKAVFSHGSHKLEMIWTAVPAVALAIIAFAQMGTWADIKFQDNFPDETYSTEKPIAIVTASQFDWRVRYPDETGSFESQDVVESAFEFVVPVNEKIVFSLRSRDVLHSFFVPNLRLKQDAVPGMEIPVWFESEEVGEFDLICAELCGWGHYKMAGQVTVLSQEDYDTWLSEKRAALYSNGAEEVADDEEYEE